MDEAWKAKTQMDLNLVRGDEDKKGFYEYVADKTKTRKNVGTFLNEMGDLATWSMEKVEVLNAFFASVFTSNTSLQESQDLKTRRKDWIKEQVPLVKEDQIMEYLNKLDMYESMSLNEMHLQVLEGAGRCHCEATLNNF
ncbi:rna-directed dna polymerase from mobile element jockey-like [Pitangus sulphuratus]|nr:rna-directed dna polymerase from mobile element jockey-like [Pitangus sulphuratus]